MINVVRNPNETPGLVCAHHHLYSSLARGMPPPHRTPASFSDILELVWWRLDRAHDEESIRWSAMLGALEALERGCTAIIDHHESPENIEGSLSIIAEACSDVGIRVSCAYGVTDRHGPDGARRGLEENKRFLSEGGKGMVGVHAAFTCTNETLEEAAGIAEDLGVGVHIHVAEGSIDDSAADRLRNLVNDRWLIVHGVHLSDNHGLSGTVIHNPRSNMNNSVGYARPSRFLNPVALGTDGIGGDMIDEFRLAYSQLREDDVQASPELAWDWLSTGWELFPEAYSDRVIWNYEPMDPWHLAFTPGVSPIEVFIDGEKVLSNGIPTCVDAEEIRARASEEAVRLHKRLTKI